jgi:hypothetical protein
MNGVLNGGKAKKLNQQKIERDYKWTEEVNKSVIFEGLGVEILWKSMKNREKWSFWGEGSKKRPQGVKKVVLEVWKGSKRSFLVVLGVVFGPGDVKKVIFWVRGLKKVVFMTWRCQKGHF